MSPFLFVLLSLIVFVAAQFNVTDPGSCSCGFYDSSTDLLYTEALVVYFNETDGLPATWTAQQFTHKREKGWTSTYRQGASPDNVVVGNASQPYWLPYANNQNALELYCDPATDDHLVTGGALSTIRQDIQFGTFRAMMRSAQPGAGGSALSMQLPYNESDIITIDMMNTDNPSTARVMALADSEYTMNYDLATNYTTIQNGTPGVAPFFPWNYMNLRLDWSHGYVNYSVNGNLTRTIRGNHSQVKPPLVGAPLVFKHWSTGDSNYMQGPPTNRSVANVAYVRAFFNSSLMSTDEHEAFDQRCRPSAACSVDDLAIRGASAYNVNATHEWKPPLKNPHLVYRSAIVAGIFCSFGVFALFHAILARWVPWHWRLNVRRWRSPGQKSKTEGHDSPRVIRKKKGDTGRGSSSSTLVSSGGSSEKSMDLKKFDHRGSASTATTVVNSRTNSASTSRAPSPSRTPSDAAYSFADLPYLPTKAKIADLYDGKSERNTSTSSTIGGVRNSKAAPLAVVAEDVNPFSDQFQTALADEKEAKDEKRVSADQVRPAPRITTVELSGSQLSVDKGKSPSVEDHPGLHFPQMHFPHVPHPHLPADDDHHQVSTTSNFHTKTEQLDEKGARRDPVRTVSLPPPAAPAPPKLALAPQNQRIDYLAGCVAFACICVTFVHFVLTFLPGVSGWGPVMHSKSDYWAKKTIGPYLLTEVWIGPFFTTSSRFLSARYLHDGKLSDIANKVLLRAPRLVIPVMMIALGQYFLIAMGVTGYLEYLPSISWSVWPYVTAYPDFGTYMNAILDLSFVMPNAAPIIVPYYCIGVLWTIPVQLQNSYTVLIGAVMVREIKNHWKRFGFYLFCIVNSWYAFNWGSCFWVGLMLSDLSVTYEYKDWVRARPWALYGILTISTLLSAASCTMFLVANDFGYDFLTPEKGLHPDWDSGLPISQTNNAGYPNYYEPRLNTIVLATSMQIIVELSVWVQKFLSFKVWTMVFPHIMTIYMIHGLIFWSLGAWVCVRLSMIGLPYWANMLVTVVVCYFTLALASYTITPMTDKVAKNACKNLWRWASEEPIPKQPTLGSFPKGLIVDRKGSEDEGQKKKCA